MKNFLFLLLFLAACAAQPPIGEKSAELPVLNLETVQDLKLKQALEKGRGSFVASASGLASVDGRLYTVADDDDAIFEIEKDASLKVVWRGLDLPADNKPRKKLKPDFESLAALDAQDWKPYGALVAWPSASGPNRNRAVVLPFKKNGKFSGGKKVDIAPLADKLKKEEKFLNMEGLFLRGENVFFVQRGNAPGARSGLFKMSKSAWLAAMHSGDWAAAQTSFEKWDLGEWAGVPLALAEVQVTADGLLALATGEQTDGNLQDGNVSGTLLVRLEDRGIVKRLGAFPRGMKLEGFVVEAGGQSLLLVDDADQVTTPSRLYRARLAP